MDKSKIYFEYGSGGSTQQAAKRGLKIFSVEINQVWIKFLKEEIQKINEILKEKIDITYLLVDLQTKIEPSYEDFKNYVQIYNHKKHNADLIYIDGKYHFSCLINLFHQVDFNTIIIVHDHERDFLLPIIKKYFDVIEQIDKTIVFKKSRFAQKLTQETIEKVQKEDFTFSDLKSSLILSLRKNFSDIIDRYKYYNNEKMIKPKNKQIWFFWWKGIKKAPDVVKFCFESIKKNFQDGNVTFLYQNNYMNYANIPSYIIEKFNQGKISKTHFSDILRLNLLSQKGGLWIDSTVFASKKVPSEIFEYPFYTIHFKYEFQYFNGKWCTFLLSSYINNIVTSFCYDVLLNYYKIYDTVWDYFLFDYIFILGNEFLPAFKRNLQNVPLNNQNVMELGRFFNWAVTDELKTTYKNLLLNTTFFKLSWKKRIRNKVDGVQSVFSWIKDQNA